MVRAFNRTDDVATARRQAIAVLDLVGLGARRDVLARQLTLSDRKRLEMARSPRVIRRDGSSRAAVTPREVFA